MTIFISWCTDNEFFAPLIRTQILDFYGCVKTRLSGTFYKMKISVASVENCDLYDKYIALLIIFHNLGLYPHVPVSLKEKIS